MATWRDVLLGLTSDTRPSASDEVAASVVDNSVNPLVEPASRASSPLVELTPLACPENIIKYSNSQFWEEFCRMS